MCTLHIKRISFLEKIGGRFIPFFYQTNTEENDIFDVFSLSVEDLFRRGDCIGLFYS